MKNPTKSNICDIIDKTLGGNTLRDYPLSRFTTFRIGGPADIIAFPQNENQICAVTEISRNERIPFIPLGAGSNLLFSDQGFRGIILSMNRMKHIEIIDNNKNEIKLLAMAGAPLPAIIAKFSQFCAVGPARLWGIPGQLGGSIACNAGAMNINIADLICEIELLDQNNKKIVSKFRDLDYGYRTMKLPPDAIVTSAILTAHKGVPDQVRNELDNAKKKRRASQPHGMASAGCVFRNPSSLNPAGAIIDRLGLKGMRMGSAEVSERHANFIVNRGKARAADVVRLIELIRKRAWDEERVSLELEIRIMESGDSN